MVFFPKTRLQGGAGPGQSISMAMGASVSSSPLSFLPVLSLLCFIVLGNVQSILLSKKSFINLSKIVDLRSDTITKPTNVMRKVMFDAEVGDDVFGEDPTVNCLEERVAKLFGKEKALFLPTGTMSNLVAIMSWCGQRGAEMILGDTSHIHMFEQGGMAQIGGVATRTLRNNPDGTMDLDMVECSVRGNNIHFPKTELIAIENTHNYCGGRILPSGYHEALRWISDKKKVPIHLDGARIWNAATATSTSLDKYANSIDSLSACLSKGLGAPAGSLLVGPTDFIGRARRLRKALGGGMRQVGILAAAGLQALDDFESGILTNDHIRAKKIASALSDIPGLRVDLDQVETNIILLHLEFEHTNTIQFVDLLKERNILVLPFGPGTLRLVLHRDVSDEDCQIAITAIRDVAAKCWIEDDKHITVASTESGRHNYTNIIYKPN
jgi:threonine aldolase